MSNYLSLGTKVKCLGYLKKRKIYYVYANQPSDKEIEEGSIPDTYIVLDNCSEPVQQSTREIVEKEFIGYVIGTKEIPTVYSYNYYEIYDHTDNTRVQVGKHEYIKCYVIAYQMSRRRYVPMNLTEEV